MLLKKGLRKTVVPSYLILTGGEWRGELVLLPLFFLLFFFVLSITSFILVCEIFIPLRAFERCPRCRSSKQFLRAK